MTAAALPVLYDLDFAIKQIYGWPVPSKMPDLYVFEAEIAPPRQFWFDRQGNPISVEEWGILRERGLDDDRHYGAHSYVRVGEDEVGEARLSTVWLGIDHGWCRFGVHQGDEDYVPIIFESMVFGGRYDQYMMRYATEEEAIKGHAEALEDLRAGLEPWWAYGGCEDDEWRMEGSV